MLRFRRAHAAIVVLTLALAACGGATRIVYESGDAALLVMADRKLSLYREQWPVARAAIARFHSWHRRTELPRYAALLDDAAVRVRRGLTRGDVEWGIQQVRARYAALVQSAVRDATPLLATLDAENVATLDRRFDADNRKRVADQLAGSPARRERLRVGAIVKRFEEWTGPLSDAQQEIVRRFVRASADYPAHADEVRLRRERELVALLDAGVQGDNGPPVDALRAHLLAWAADRTPERQRHEARFVELVLELDRSLTAAQRAHAVERAKDYAEDFRALARRSS